MSYMRFFVAKSESSYSFVVASPTTNVSNYLKKSPNGATTGLLCSVFRVNKLFLRPNKKRGEGRRGGVAASLPPRVHGLHVANRVSR